jgi:rSAM/selenodomain-associated transferase 2
LKISVIIPVLNEEKTIFTALEELLTQHHPEEVLVVDGGSSDQTVKLASEWTRVIASPKGRACQMNTGSREARGDVFLFLHSDTRLPQGGLFTIKEAIKRGAQAGRFRMTFDEKHWILSLNSFMTRFHFCSYGDSGFFVTRSLFMEMGGFRENVLLEDIDFYRCLRKRTQPVILKDSVMTAARRFSNTGLVRQKIINFFLLSLHSLGLNIDPLKKKLYPDVR